MRFKGIELCCPHCRGDLEEVPGTAPALRCAACAAQFPVILGIPDLRVFPDPYIDIEADRAKGLRVAERLESSSFSELLDYYYSITDVVPAKDAERYKRGLMGAAARAAAALEGWEAEAPAEPAFRSSGSAGASPSLCRSRLLEIGCGTGPLLVAAARRYENVVGVDIAFRWLVVAKKRLAEAGIDLPLVCACAEALPFRDVAFDRVVADSVLEHVRDQKQTLTECNRVLRAGGRMFVITPNKYSLGPDPQVGLWAGGYLPERWIAAYVRRRGGIPPQRRLLSARSLPRLIRQAGFAPPHLGLPDVADGQRRQFSRLMRLLIDGYHMAKRLPVTRQILHWVGPMYHAVSDKPQPA